MRVTVSEPIFGANLGEANIRIHPASACEGRACPFHNPSNHKMKNWDINIRLDNHGLVERICSHGVGHGDPDSVRYFKSIGITHMDVHGCDGCCQ